MTVFLIALGVIAVVLSIGLSISATFNVTYDKGWKTTVTILGREREIKLTKLLSFILFPDKSAQEVKKGRNKSKAKETHGEQPAKSTDDAEKKSPKKKGGQKGKKTKNQSKPNYIQRVLNEEGILGIFHLISNTIQSASTAVNTLFSGFHIYLIYVKMIIGGGDAFDIADKYGSICKYYFPIKGFILNNKNVDDYDETFYADFIAPSSEYAFQFIGSINAGTLLRVILSAGKTFLFNLLSNKQ